MARKQVVADAAKRRQAIFRYLRSYVAKNGYAPTIQEIGAHVGLKSPNATRNHLMRLQDEGKIRITPKVARAIVLTEDVRKAS